MQVDNASKMRKNIFLSDLRNSKLFSQVWQKQRGKQVLYLHQNMSIITKYYTSEILFRKGKFAS